MGERKPFEFFLLRYVPDAVKEEFVNIGVVLCEKEKEAGFAEVRFTHDWERVYCLDPEADVELLQGLERDIRGRLADPQALVDWLEDSFSNVVQLSSGKGCLAEDPESEIETLVSLYLERHPVAGKVKREARGRQLILEQMRDAFEKAGVSKFVDRNIAIGPYAGTDDSSRIDFGYGVGDRVKLFQAVSMKASMTAALSLTSRYEQIKKNPARLTQQAPMLTAVVDDDFDKIRIEVPFTLSLMRREGIMVVPVAEMPAIAEVARRELRL